MNNNVNHTEKDMEQRITETLDRCMSGIDTAPSLRPIVDKKLAENPRPEKKSIPVRRFAVPAVALALCVCLVITGSHFGMFRWPDRIRTPETIVTAQPVPLAQPKGEGGEGVPITLSSQLSAAEEGKYDERTIAVFTVLDQFCMAWERKNPEQMAALCGCAPGDESDDAVHARDVIQSLVGAISPRGRLIEDALELVLPEDDSPVTVSVVVTDIPRQAKYRFGIRLLRQPDESWLIDPASLEKCEELEYIGKNVIAVRDYYDLPAAAPSAAPEESWRKWMTDEGRGSEAEALRPVGLSCENEGFRFTVEAAAVNDESIDVLYSLEDLEGNRINEETHIWGNVDVMCGGIGENILRTNVGILYTPGRMSARLGHYLTDGTAVPGQNQSAVFSLDMLGLLDHEILDLSPYLAEYGESAKAVDLEAVSPGWMVRWDGPDADPPSRILDVASPLDISIHPNVRLDGIGIIDGKCHVRLRYVDNDLIAKSAASRSFRPLDAVLILSTKANEVYPYSSRLDVAEVRCEKRDGIEVDEHEFVFSLEEADEIPLYIRSCSGIVDGNWKVELPLDSIWTGPEDFAGAETPGYYEFRLTYTLNEDGTAVVSGYGGKDHFQLTRQMVIPAEIEGHPVTAIADNAFMDWYGLESVVVSDTVTAIGDRAFMGCTKLKSVDLPEGLRTIGEQAFFDTGLQEVIIPDSVISFGNQAFIILYPGDRLELGIPRTAELITWCSTNRIPFTIRDSEPAAEPAEKPVEELAAKPAE